MLAKDRVQSVPIKRQYKGIFYLPNGIHISNDFAGARLSVVALTNNNLVTVLIAPENKPINMSPWYSFKIRSESKKRISLKLTYSDNTFHRYYPKLS
tara:strand:- start:164 stop:454 length:291 start_codon:yes stop_codon:yes gene_type:complete